MTTEGKRETASRILLESRLRYHHCCLREDATNPELITLERLTLVRGRAERVREIREDAKVAALSFFGRVESVT